MIKDIDKFENLKNKYQNESYYILTSGHSVAQFEFGDDKLQYAEEIKIILGKYQDPSH
jgi:hypothetical protein